MYAGCKEMLVFLYFEVSARCSAKLSDPQVLTGTKARQCYIYSDFLQLLPEHGRCSNLHFRGQSIPLHLAYAKTSLYTPVLRDVLSIMITPEENFRVCDCGLVTEILDAGVDNVAGDSTQVTVC